MSGAHKEWRRYEEAEDLYIRTHWKKPGQSGGSIGKHLGRTACSIRARAQKLGLSNVNNRVSYGRRLALARKAEQAPVAVVVAFPVRPALARLAQFDPLFTRVVSDKLAGRAP